MTHKEAVNDLKAIKEYFEQESGAYPISLEYAIKVLKNELSADRPQGEWKHLKGDEWLCSECGHVIWTEGSWEHPLERGKDYCEHCGAKMKGANDETD